MTETNTAAVSAAVKSLDSPCAKTSVQVTVQRQRQDDGDDASTKRVAINITSHALQYDTTANNDSNGNSKYIMCSLLLQIGKLLGVQPSYAPSPYISSIFNEILEKWSVQRFEGENNDDMLRKVEHLSEINDGDELILCCGDYANDSSPDSASSVGVDLMELLPSKFNIVAVSLASASMEKEGNTSERGKDMCSGDVNEGSDGDSDIEDVTDLYVSKKSLSSPEVIDLEDASSDADAGESCFWEYDDHGNMKKSANYPTNQKGHAKSLNNSENNDASDDDEISHVGSAQDVESNGNDSDSSSGVEDVTDMMMTKRNDQVKKQIDDAEEINDSDQDCGDSNQKVAGKKRKQAQRSPSPVKRKRGKKKIESPIEVLIDEKDIPDCPGAKSSQHKDACDSFGGNTPSNNTVDVSIKQRIVKLLNTGFHSSANEHEARNAMKLARRLMERYNLDQAVLLQERGDGSLNDFSTTSDNEGSALQGGIVTTQIRNKKQQKPLSPFPRWHDFLIQPVCLNFHVEAFKTIARATSRRTGACSVTFYGIHTNSQLAAYAFKIASERIALMAATYEPPRKSTLPRTSMETRTARLSYALGIVKGLERDVKEGLLKEEERRMAKLRKAQRAAKKGEAHHEDDDSSNERDNSCFRDVRSHDDFEGKLDDEADQPQISQDKANCFNSPEKLGKLEQENTAHLALVNHHKNIASKILKTQNIKVRSGRKHKSITLNRTAYEKGVIDAKEIDLNQQAIR